MPTGKQITAFFAAAALGAGLGIAGHQQVEKQKWRSAVSAIVKPVMVKEFSSDTMQPYDGKQYGRYARVPQTRLMIVLSTA